MTRPTLTVLAGANGSGKTTLTRGNPDAIASPLQPSSGLTPLAAARQVLKAAENHLRRKESFAVETTLSGKNYRRMMLNAHTYGFEIMLVYIGTWNRDGIDQPDSHPESSAGRQDVPEADVRRRYRRSFENLPTAIKGSDHTILFDNSTDDGYRLIAVLSAINSRWFAPKPTRINFDL